MQHSDGMIVISGMKSTDLKNLIQTGEGTFLEFKKTIPSAEKIAREMAAFANTYGGTLLIGVNDDKTITGVGGYFEEEYLLRKAAEENCIPPLNIRVEMVHVGDKEVMVVTVPEAEVKPVYNKGKDKRSVFIRREDKSVMASDEMIEILKQTTSGKGATFEYGENEQTLFRYLNEYGEITVSALARLLNVTTFRASKILVNLVAAGVLKLTAREDVEYFTFLNKS